MTEISFIEALEIAINENHGVVSGPANVIDVDGIIEHNNAIYEYLETLSERQIATQLDHQEGRLYAWWRTGVITDRQHNDMLKEVRMQAVKIVKTQSSTDLYRDQATLEKGIKFNVLCQNCNASGGMDSIDLQSAVNGISHELKLFVEWYTIQHNENAKKYYGAFRC